MNNDPNDLVVPGELSASWQKVDTFPKNPRAGRTVFYNPDSTLYWYDGAKWIKAKASAGGGFSYYNIKVDEVVIVPDGQAMNLTHSLTVDGTIVLDGMICDG